MNKCITTLILFLTLYSIGIKSGAEQAAQAFKNEATSEFSNELTGDIGLAVYSQNSIIRSDSSSTQVFPYTYFDYGRFFARIDTFGFKTLALGYGYLEIAGKYSTEGFTPKGSPYSLLNQRNSPIPLGIGTFQLTPVGAFFIHGYQDVNSSKGATGEFTYAAQVELPHSVKIYPLFGFDYANKHYLNYFYAISPNESQRTGLNTYSPSDGVSPFAAIIFEVPIAEHWIINTLIKQQKLASTIVNSPLVSDRHLNNMLISLNYRFE